MTEEEEREELQLLINILSNSIKTIEGKLPKEEYRDYIDNVVTLQTYINQVLKS